MIIKKKLDKVLGGYGKETFLGSIGVIGALLFGVLYFLFLVSFFGLVVYSFFTLVVILWDGKRLVCNLDRMKSLPPN